MRRGSLSLAPRLVVLLATASLALAGDVDRARELIKSWNPDDPRARELHDLARKPAVRKWLRASIREQWTNEGGRGIVERYFMVLARTGAGREDVEFLVEGAAEESAGSYSYLSRFAQGLLERAPPALDVEPLLDLIARRAASTLYDVEAANSIWLLAHRLPRDRLERALGAAWKEATPLERRQQPDSGCVELTLLGPDGKPPEDLLWIQDAGASRPSQFVVWPDGKARLERRFGHGKTILESELRIAVPGFEESEKTKVSFRKGEVSGAEVRLGKQRAWVRGRLAPAPTAPLFARLTSGLTVGYCPPPYRQPGGELSTPVRSDGVFQAPANRWGRVLLILDIDGNVFHVQPVDIPDGVIDVDLGEVKLAPRRDLADVPIYVVWPPALPRGKYFQGYVNWQSKDPSVPGGKTNFYRASGKKRGKVFVGLARNVPPGKYTVGAKFKREKDQGEVAPFEMSITVKGMKDALVLEPRKEKEKRKDAPAPKAAAPTGAGVPVAHGDRFVLRRSPSGQVHLLVADSRGIVHLVREGESFGPERRLFKAPAAPKEENAPLGWTSFIDCVGDKDGSLHLFRLTQRTQEHRGLYYARAPREGVGPPRWSSLADEPSPHDNYGDPTVVPRKNGALEVFAPVIRIRKDQAVTIVERTRFFRGAIQGGKLQALPSIQLDQGSPASNNFQARILATPEGEAHALYPGDDTSLSWMLLVQNQEKPAGDVPDTSRFEAARTALGARGEVYLAIPIQNDNEKHPRFWIGTARIGERFTARGILTGTFSSHGKISMAMTPGGDVYLVGSLRPPGDEDGRVTLWHLSGAFPPEPIPTPWLDRSGEEPQAVFIEERKAVVAWDRHGDIHVETFALPDR